MHGRVNCANIHGCGGSEVFESDLKSDPSRWRDHVDRLHALQESAVQGDVSAALELLSAYPDHVEFNEARQSIQLAGCSKDVLSGNIPLSDAQLSAISAVQ